MCCEKTPTPTILAGDFNLDRRDMPDFPGYDYVTSYHYDHILTNMRHGKRCGIALDEDGKPVKDPCGKSINGSDHCAVFGMLEI